MNFFKTMWEDVTHGRNVDAYLALALGIAATIIGVLGGSVEVIIAITSSTLALIAFTLLKDRSNANSITETLHSLQQTLSNTSKIAIRDEYTHEIKTAITQAKHELCILLRMGSTLNSYHASIESLLRGGCNIRVMICSEDSIATGAIEFRSYSGHKQDDIHREMENTKAYFLHLTDRLKGVTSCGKLELRTIPYMPSLLIFMSDPQQPTGKVFAFLGTFRIHSYSAPTIKIDRSQDAILFEHFKNDFENHWNAATPVTGI